MILWGPPGVGKTTIANIVAHSLKVPYYQLSAISSGVKEIREVIEESKKTKRSILFIDEIHRFNKGQQDALLGAVEKGIITLIGATTENPSFEVNAALLSRCQVYVLKPLNEDDLLNLLKQVIIKDEWLQSKNIEFKETAALFNISGGDARKLLNLVELVVQSFATPHKDVPFSSSTSVQAQKPGGIAITDNFVMEVAQTKVALYDKQGEQHYDIISAFIKSVKGSDPNGAVYWLARMIEGGEDVKYIARRLVVLASEDVGNANPTALVLATNTFQAVHVIGYPEARIILAQCAIYLASSPKSNAAYVAINKAQEAITQTGDLPVPFHIRNAPTGLMKQLDYGKGYKYPHAFAGNFVEQEYLPDKLKETKFYDPANNAREEELRKYLKGKWKEKYGY